MINNGNCPKCSQPTECQSVDIGIGVQYGPPYCSDCGWSSYEYANKIIDGWYHDATGAIYNVDKLIEHAYNFGGQELADLIKEAFESKV